MDIDLLGRIENSIETITKVTREICRQEVEPDGIAFDLASIEAERIAEDADCKFFPLMQLFHQISCMKGEKGSLFKISLKILSVRYFLFFYIGIGISLFEG